MARLILLNKPFNTLSQFTDDQGRQTLAHCLSEKDVYPCGRLDYDSEGLLLLTDDGRLQQRVSHPRFKLGKTYWVQVEGTPDERALTALRQGVRLKDGMTRPCKAQIVSEPDWLWPRNPPIRQRVNDRTRWLMLEIREGRNRQVRRMTAAIGHPTLRLVRSQIGQWSLADLKPGEWTETRVNLPRA